MLDWRQHCVCYSYGKESAKLNKSIRVTENNIFDLDGGPKNDKPKWFPRLRMYTCRRLIQKPTLVGLFISKAADNCRASGTFTETHFLLKYRIWLFRMWRKNEPLPPLRFGGIAGQERPVFGVWRIWKNISPTRLRSQREPDERTSQYEEYNAGFPGLASKTTLSIQSENLKPPKQEQTMTRRIDFWKTNGERNNKLQLLCYWSQLLLRY